VYDRLGRSQSAPTVVPGFLALFSSIQKALGEGVQNGSFFPGRFRESILQSLVFPIENGVPHVLLDPPVAEVLLAGRIFLKQLQDVKTETRFNHLRESFTCAHLLHGLSQSGIDILDLLKRLKTQVASIRSRTRIF